MKIYFKMLCILTCAFFILPSMILAQSKGIIIGFEESEIEIVTESGDYVDISVEELGPPLELELLQILDSGGWEIINSEGTKFIVDRGDLTLSPDFKSRKNKGRGKCHDYSGGGVLGVGDC